jgi:hypothetical protein
VQLADKLVDGREAAHAEAQQREDVAERGEQTMPTPAIEAVQDKSLELRSQLLGAIRMVLDDQTLSIGSLRLPHREARALEALQVATSGKSADLHQFVYAEDRRDLLEQALAVLQPNLTRADDLTAIELHAQFADLAERVGDLRQQLSHLEDAQDELENQQVAPKQAATDATDKPASDPDAPRPASTLSGPDPEVTELPTPLSTLSGPGPEISETPSPTTLTGPDVAEPSRPPTSLSGSGPEAPDPPPAPTTLSGDTDGGDAEKPTKSWWRKPFG